MKQYDVITISEVQEYIKWKKKDMSLVDVIFGRLFSFFIGFIKAKGNTRVMLEMKLTNISEINKKLKKIIENPYLETLEQ